MKSGIFLVVLVSVGLAAADYATGTGFGAEDVDNPVPSFQEPNTRNKNKDKESNGQAAMIRLLEDILEEVKGIREDSAQRLKFEKGRINIQDLRDA